MVITSSKSNIGHCEGSAGVSGFLKCVLLCLPRPQNLAEIVSFEVVCDVEVRGGHPELPPELPEPAPRFFRDLL